MSTRTVAGTAPALKPVHHAPVLVGVDDRTDSALAVSWAADEARNRGVPLTVVRGFTWAMAAPYWTSDDRYIVAGLRQDAEKIVKHAVEQVRAQDPELEVRVDIAEKYPPDLLTERSADASLIVLGTGHHGPVTRAVMGSVSTQVAAAADVPVVVVCGPPPLGGGTGTVVAGVKPDETAQPVLAFAFDHAARHGLAVRAVLCWRATGLTDATHLPDRAKRWLSEALAGWREQYPEVPVTAVAERTEAAPALIEESSNANLLVVGRHGRTPRLGSVLGSVSQAAIHHAVRPVAVVPVTPPDER